MDVGFIGLGIMGRHMAKHLQGAGHQLYVCQHNAPLPFEMIEGGAVECATPKEIAEQSDVVISIVPDTPDVEDVLFGVGGVAEGLSPGKLFMDMSTISPTATKDFARQIEAQDCLYLDAPVSGGDVGAKAGTLSIMVGGPIKALERARPLLELMGKTITHIGVENGTGQTCKAANQIAVAVTMQGVAEALTFAEKAGADPVVVRAALLGGFAGSKIMEVHGQRMLDGDYEPGFMVKLHRKDLNIVLETAKELGLDLAGAELVKGRYDALVEDGMGKKDMAVLKEMVG